MSTTTIARPYATAAFETAKQSNQLSLWSNALKQLSSALLDNKVKSILKNPLYTSAQLTHFFIDILHAACGNGPNHELEAIANFIRLLAEKKRLILLSDISNLFNDALEKTSGYLSLRVISAFEMDEAQKKQSHDKLSKQFNSKLNLVFDVDKTIIGGLLVRSANWVLDDTVRGRLGRLRSALG